ncbi:MAG: hypothetical protein WA208_18555 [Thermoanaerobaculia bacterium]
MYARYEQLTRQELYEQIWSVPATKLSERFGLSGRGLAKLCERHEIPVPDRGWWAKKAAGQDVKQLPLPKPSNPYLDRIEVRVREDWRTYVSEDELKWFEQQIAAEPSRPPLIVREEDDSRHPLIVRARRERKDSAPAPLHFALDVSKEQRPRALRLAAAIVEGCEQRDYSFAPGPDAATGEATVVILGQHIGVAVVEPYAKVPHVLTKAEAREKAVGRGWGIPDFDSVRSGTLAIALTHSADGERRTFSAKSDQPLEATLPEFFKALPKIALRMKADKNWHAEQERIRKEEADRRAELERLRREEQARLAAEKRRRNELLRASASLRRSNDILALVTAVEAAAEERGLLDKIAAWARYAQTVANDLNPVDPILVAETHVSQRTPSK